MRTLTAMILGGGFLLAASFAAAQRPGGGPDAPPNAAGADDLVARMMAFDKDKDGKLTRSEVTDERLVRLFDRADADKTGRSRRPSWPPSRRGNRRAPGGAARVDPAGR